MIMVVNVVTKICIVSCSDCTRFSRDNVHVELWKLHVISHVQQTVAGIVTVVHAPMKGFHAFPKMIVVDQHKSRVVHCVIKPVQ